MSNTDELRDMSCHICGSQSFEWGRVMGHYYLAYLSDDAPKSLFNTGAKKTKARCCKNCGNIQVFTADD